MNYYAVPSRAAPPSRSRLHPRALLHREESAGREPGGGRDFRGRQPGVDFHHRHEGDGTMTAARASFLRSPRIVPGADTICRWG